MPKDVFSYYGIPPEEAAIRGFKLADYLEVESPELVKFATQIPKNLSSYIDKFEIIWSLPILEKYATRRRLDLFIAFREILQNALDAEHEKYGYDGINVRIEVSSLGTHVIDRGRGITWRAFLIGGSEKPEWMRGHFGEGLDLATLVFAINGHPVYFFTRNVVFKTVYYPPMDAYLVVFGRSKVDISGTHVLIYGWKLPKDMLKKVYWKMNEDLELIGRVNIRDMPNMVFKDKKSTKLYVRDIYVNESKEITWKPFYYTYNLWWLDLDPNRTNVASSSQLYEQVRDVLIRVPKAFMEFVENNTWMKEYGGVTYYTMSDAEKYFEGGLSFWAVDESDPNIAKTLELLRDFVKKRGISAYSDLTDLDAVPAVGHEGGIVILVPSGYKYVFGKILKKADEFVIESVERTVRKAKVVDEESLGFSSLYKLGKFRLLIKFINDRRYVPRDKKLDLVPIIGRSHAVNNVAYVNIKDDDRAYVHEIAHTYGYAIYGSADDVSENFERALEDVAVFALEVNREYRSALERIDNGCVRGYINADRSLTDDLTKEFRSTSLYLLDFDDLNVDPPALMVGKIDEYGLHIYPLTYLKMSYFYYKVSSIEMPYFKAYDEVTFRLADVIGEEIKHSLGMPSRIDEVVKSFIANFGDHWRSTVDNVMKYTNRAVETFLREYPAKGRYVVIKYDMRKDTYVVFKEVVRVD